MSILVDQKTRLVVQGITGREGSFHARQCQAYGTQVVAGVTPRRGGTSVDGIPVFDTVEQAVQETGANTSIIFVPAPFATDAILEAVDAKIALIVAITEGIPALDMVTIHQALQSKPVWLIGPNCPGIISPGKAKVGIMPHDVFLPGHVGVVSRSGTLLYESVSQLSALGIGQSTCLGIGGDPLPGTTFLDALRLFNADEETHALLLIGEIGGMAEQEAAHFIREHMRKPVVGFVAGVTAPPGRRMGHAGAIISGSGEAANDKLLALQAAGVVTVQSPAAIGDTMAQVLKAAGLLH